MLQYQIKRNKLTSLSYRVGDTIHDLSYLKESESVWNMFESLLLAGDVRTATELYKLAFSVAASKNWTRLRSGIWYVQYAGHLLKVVSIGGVEVSLEHANDASQVSKDLALKAAEISYYIRRRWYDNRATQTAKRDARRPR